MIKSLVNPNSPEHVSSEEEIASIKKELGPNDMLIWCKKDAGGAYTYIVADYKKVRAAVTSFDDAIACAKVFLGALTHANRVIARADESFAKLEAAGKTITEVFIDMANKKAVAEAKDRRDNPMPSMGVVRNMRPGSIGRGMSMGRSSAMIKELLDEIQGEIKLDPDALDKAHAADRKKREEMNANDKEWEAFQDFMAGFFKSTDLK